jgi:hypothetical protein
MASWLLGTRRRTARAAIALLWAAPLTACGSDDDLVVTVIVPTEIAVDPNDFLGDVACSPNPGAMRSYVMTLSAWQDENDSTPFVIGSSQPTSCALAAGFREPVVVGQRYTAEVDGYELPPGEIVPFGGGSSGARQMVRASDGTRVEPRWVAHCGEGAASAAVAELNRRVFVRPCVELEDLAGSPTAILFPPSVVLGDDPCATAASIDIVTESGNAPSALGVACDAEPLVIDAVAGERYSFYVTTADGVAPVEGALCHATAAAGQTITPVCAALSASGSARVSLAGLTLRASREALCPAGFSFDIVGEEGTLNPVPIPCSAQTIVSPLEPGIYLFDIVVYDGTGGVQQQAPTCAAAVEAGKISDATCLP